MNAKWTSLWRDLDLPWAKPSPRKRALISCLSCGHPKKGWEGARGRRRRLFRFLSLPSANRVVVTVIGSCLQFN